MELMGSFYSGIEASLVKTNFFTSFKMRPLFDTLSRIEAGVAKKEWRRGCDAPNAQSLRAARDVLERLMLVGYVPTGITPSAEGGIGIYFERGKKYADIEVLNSGQALGVTSDRVAEKIIPFTISTSQQGYDRAIQRVVEFFLPNA